MFKIEIFNSYGYSDEYNSGVVNNTDVISCVFSTKNTIALYNCIMTNFGNGKFDLEGRIILRTLNYDGTESDIRTFTKATVINAHSYTIDFNPINTKFDISVTMNSEIVYPTIFDNTSFSVTNPDSDVDEETETVKSKPFWFRSFIRRGTIA